MGYYTDYEMTISFLKETDKTTEEKIRQAIDNMLDRLLGDGYDTWGDGWYMPELKWYDHDMDMHALSVNFPDVRFDLSGRGEEQDDIWEATWINGFCHQRWAEVPPFDSSQLVPYTGAVREDMLPPPEPEVESCADPGDII